MNSFKCFLYHPMVRVSPSSKDVQGFQPVFLYVNSGSATETRSIGRSSRSPNNGWTSEPVISNSFSTISLTVVVRPEPISRESSVTSLFLDRTIIPSTTSSIYTQSITLRPLDNLGVSFFKSDNVGD